MHNTVISIHRGPKKRSREQSSTNRTSTEREMFCSMHEGGLRTPRFYVSPVSANFILGASLLVSRLVHAEAAAVLTGARHGSTTRRRPPGAQAGGRTKVRIQRAKAILGRSPLPNTNNSCSSVNKLVSACVSHLRAGLLRIAKGWDSVLCAVLIISERWQVQLRGFPDDKPQVKIEYSEWRCSLHLIINELEVKRV